MERVAVVVGILICAAALMHDVAADAPVVERDYAAQVARLEHDIATLSERTQQQEVAHEALAATVNTALASRLETAPPVVTPAAPPVVSPPAGGAVRTQPAPASRQPMRYGYCVGPGCSAGSAYTYRTSRTAGPIRRLLGRR